MAIRLVGRVVEERRIGDGRDIVTRTEYGWRGPVVEAGPCYSDELPSHETRYRYTARGELEAQIEREGGLERESRYRYDAEGNHVGSTLVDGRELWMSHDEVGRLLARGYVDGGGRAVELERYRYDLEGRVVSVEADGEGVSTIEYVDARHEVELLYGGEVTIERERDGVGRLAGQRTRSADGVVVESFRYDLAGRLEARRVEVGGRVGEEITLYDGEGRPIERRGMEPGRGQVLAYDVQGRVVRDEVTEGTIATRGYNTEGWLAWQMVGEEERTEYRYDALGRLEGMVWGEGGVESYAWDARGRLVGVTDRRGGVTRLEYAALDSGVRLTDALGGTWANLYDAAGRLVRQTGPWARRRCGSTTRSRDCCGLWRGPAASGRSTCGTSTDYSWGCGSATGTWRGNGATSTTRMDG